MTQLPSPLTSPDCDLRDFPFMPLDVVRLRDSDRTMPSSPDEFFAAFMLRCASWHQFPAASIPNDDKALAELSGSGRRWNKVKTAALREWVLCDDGRFYHPETANYANRVWPKKQRYLARIIRRLEIESGAWAALRTAVFERDDYTCRYCGARGVRLECDHVVPVAKGGQTHIENLATACLPCNRSKGSKTLQEWRP